MKATQIDRPVTVDLIGSFVNAAYVSNEESGSKMAEEDVNGNSAVDEGKESKSGVILREKTGRKKPGAGNGLSQKSGYENVSPENVQGNRVWWRHLFLLL